jgi:hypothetical protein
MSVYTQFNQQREIQIKNTFDAKMHKIDKLKTHAPTDPGGEAQARAERHRLRVAAAEEFCDARRILHKVYGLYQEKPDGK